MRSGQPDGFRACEAFMPSRVHCSEGMQHDCKQLVGEEKGGHNRKTMEFPC